MQIRMVFRKDGNTLEIAILEPSPRKPSGIPGKHHLDPEPGRVQTCIRRIAAAHCRPLAAERKHGSPARFISRSAELGGASRARCAAPGEFRDRLHFVATDTNGIDATRGPCLLSLPMRSSRSKLLLISLAAILFAAVLAQAVEQHSEGIFAVCNSEHQNTGQDGGSHCPCVCHHHHQTAVAGWQMSMPGPLAVVSDVLEESQSISEAPPASIEYPPQLA